MEDFNPLKNIAVRAQEGSVSRVRGEPFALQMEKMLSYVDCRLDLQ